MSETEIADEAEAALRAIRDLTSKRCDEISAINAHAIAKMALKKIRSLRRARSVHEGKT